MKVTAIIQARMGSKRLPEKVLANIENKPMLYRVVERTLQAKQLNDIVIATSEDFKDNKIERLAREGNFKVFRGAEHDCLDRYYKAAKKFNINTVVRITGDCPLICPDVINKVVREYLKGGFDYVSNTLFPSYPDGCDVEIFSFRALEKAWKESRDVVEREHVTPFIKNSGKFKIKNITSKNPVDPKEFRWSVDKAEDLKFVRKVYKHLYTGNNRVFSMKKIMSFLKKHPEVKEINRGVAINEGYYRSILELPKIKSGKPKIKKSLALKKRAENLIPDCSQTFSKGPTQFIQGVAPVFLEKGKGSRVWDVDGNEYIDYAMALGPIILGHNYPAVTDAVKKILTKGTTFTLPHRLESELAQLLCDLIPCAEMVRFGKNGSDATSGAVRVARAYTNREKVVCCGYHGWQDWYITTTTRNKGIPQNIKKNTLTFDYNKIETLEKIFASNRGKIACVIMEPVGIIEPQNNFLKNVKELTHKNGALLIFDEVITGFRISLGGAQEFFKITPDLACFGKAMGNGLPISAVVGKKKIMNLFKEVFYSFTFGGEILSIAATIATIKELRKKSVIRHIWEQGRKIKDGYNVLAREYGLEKYTQCVGLAPRTVVIFKNKKGEEDLLLKSLFQQECIKRGVLFTGGHNISYSHSHKDIDYTIRVYRTALEILKNAIADNKVKALLRGEAVRPVFRKA